MKMLFPKYLCFLCLWAVSTLFHACDLLPALALSVTLKGLEGILNRVHDIFALFFFLQQSI